MPKPPKQILNTRKASDAAKAAELLNLIETAIENPETGFDGQPWSYFIDPIRYPQPVVAIVRLEFAKSGWDTTSGHPMDPKDNGYDLVFTEARLPPDVGRRAQGLAEHLQN